MNTLSLPPPYRALQLSSLITVFLTSASLSALAQYSVHTIGVFPYDDTFVNRVTLDGHVLGNFAGTYQAFHWFEGTFHPIDQSQTLPKTAAWDIDASGTIVGHFDTPPPRYYTLAAYWNPLFHSMGTLTPDCLSISRAYAVAGGIIVGESGSSDCTLLVPVYSSVGSSFTAFPMPVEAREGRASCINPAGTTAAGRISGPLYIGGHAAKWPIAGGCVDVGSQLGTGDSEAIAINNNDDLLCNHAGQFVLWTGSAQPIKYNGRVCYARGLNDLRQVVADSVDDNGHQISIVWQNGVSQVLPALPATLFTEVWNINNQGHVFGFCVMPSYEAYFVEWIPPTFGIDISDSAGNPSFQDWQAVTNLGKQFVIVDGWMGAHINIYAERQLAGARSVGMPTAGYFVLNFASGDDGSCQVRKALKAFGGEAQYLKFLAVDVEDALVPPNYNTPEGHAAAAARVSEAVQTIWRAGLRPIIYTKEDYWRDIVGNPVEYDNLPLWLTADSNTTPPDLPDVSFGGWSKAAAKQYEKEKYLPGLSSMQVDLDIFTGEPFDPISLIPYNFPPPEIHFSVASGILTVKWCDEDISFRLEQSQNLNGPWQSVPTQGSSYSVTISGQAPANMLFRLRQQ